MSNLRRNARDESGFVMVIVITVLFVSTVLAVAALAATLDSRTGTERSAHQRAAQQAADAGIQATLYQQSQNRIGTTGSSYDLNGGPLSALALTQLLDCVVPQLGANLTVTGLTYVAANAAGVCPASSATGATGATGTALGNNAFETAEYIPAPANPLATGSERDLSPKIVSLGWQGSAASNTTGNVFAREEAILSPITPLPVVGANGNLALSGLSLLGIPLTTVVNGDLAANTSLTLPLVTLGVNLTLSNGLLAVFKCGCARPTGIPVANFVQTPVPNRQPISVSSTKSSCPTLDSAGHAGCSAFSTYYNSGTDSVTVPTGKTMTIYGGDYVFCNFSAAGSVNAIPSTSTPVRIFIDNPNSSRCVGNLGGVTAPNTTNSVFTNKPCSLSSCSSKFWPEGNFYSANGIQNNGVLTDMPSGLQIYVVGDGESPPFDDNTYVQLGTPPTSLLGGTNNLSQQEIVYAPTSDVLMTTANCLVTCTGGLFFGNLIGNDVTATALTFSQDLDLANDPLYNGLNVFQVQQEIQCSPLPTDSSGNTYQYLTGNATTDTNGC